SADELLPALDSIGDAEQRKAVAEAIYDYSAQHRPLPNIGALAHIRMTGSANQDHRQPIPLSKIKPLLVVRTPQEFLKTFAIWMGAYLAAFWVVHFAWRLLQFRGDGAILPALHVLTGLGLILMIS